MGDRVQIGDTKGDVIDIGLLRTTLMEIGNWVSRDMYSGRIVRIPNSTVLKGSVFNYSQGFQFIWDEILKWCLQPPAIASLPGRCFCG